MNCDRISDLFGDLHEGQLDGAIGDKMRQHLGNCPDCREDFKWYGFTVQALASLERVSPPANFVAQVRARCEAADSSWWFYSFKETFSHLPYLPLPVGVTAAVLVGVFALGLYNYAPTPILESVASTHSAQTSAPGPGVRVTLPATVSAHALSPAVQAGLGTDKLFVESPRIDLAVESLKRILPGIQGKLLEEPRSADVGSAPVLAVVIPSQAYGDLITELINHGAVVAGPPSSQAESTSQPGTDANQVLYIQFKSR
jgi:hypothetical protein